MTPKVLMCGNNVSTWRQ